MIDYILMVNSDCTIFGNDNNFSTHIDVTGRYTIGEDVTEITPHKVTPAQYDEMVAMLEAGCKTFVNWRETRTYKTPQDVPNN